MVRVLFYLQTAFSLWMLVDAVRRGAPKHWYWIVMVPFGEWAYFFSVKIHDREFDFLRKGFTGLTEKKVTVDDLAYRVQQTPSFANKLRLGQGLYDSGAFVDAKTAFEAALELRESSDARYGLGLAEMELDNPEQAVQAFSAVIESEPSFMDYAPWIDLARGLAAAGRTDEAIERLELLVVKSPRLAHRAQLAYALKVSGREADARQTLRAGLAEHERSPKFIKRRDRGAKRLAKRLLKELDQPTDGQRAPG